MASQKVVIEYTHRSYSPPTDEEALLVTCKVTFSEYANPQFLNLAGARDHLEGEGFTQQPEIHPVNKYQFGRWCPRWREVWGKEIEDPDPATSWTIWSPEAQKARQESTMRARGYWPGLARTSTRAIVCRPLRGGWQFQREFAQALGDLLPQFTFNSRRNWWEADLTELQTAHEALGRIHLSDGAAEYLGEVA